jgi:CRP/FNR family transcriptional regulator, cyclic AMP receptor protein
MIHEHDLKGIPLFAQLESAELCKLAAIMKERRAPKGSYLVYAEDTGASILFLVEGKAKVTLVSPDGKEIVLYSLVEGDFFGEIAVLSGEDRSANVVANSDCRVFIIGAEDFRRHVQQNSGLALAMMKELALRLRASTAKIGDLALLDVYRRVARTLKSLAVAVKTDEGEILRIEERPTHQELANMVGTSREMVTRALKGLEEDDCIVIENKAIIIKKLPN